MPGIFRDDAPCAPTSTPPWSRRNACRSPPSSRIDRPAAASCSCTNPETSLPAALLDLMRALARGGLGGGGPAPVPPRTGAQRQRGVRRNPVRGLRRHLRLAGRTRHLPGLCGVLGFDDAGTAALLVATNRPVGAAVSVSAHGIVAAPLTDDTPALVDAAPSLRAPWLGLYGEDDPRTPPEHVERLRDAVARSDAPTNIVSYVGLAHRADEPPVPEPSADDDDPLVVAILDAQRRIFDWFDSNLR